MSVDNAIAVAELIAVLGSVEGRKRLQKIVHLIQQTDAAPFQYRFILHYFGPFSYELAGDLDFLGSVGLVCEAPPAGGTGSYVYSPPSGVTRDRIRGRTIGDGQPESEWVLRARSLNKEKTGTLEALSTLVFLSRRGYEGEELRKKFAQVKPHLTENYESASQRGEDLGLLAPRSAA